MNDRFLKDYHQPPRREFQRALSQRLQLQSKKAEKMTIPILRSFALGALTLFLALALVLAISPAARAQMLELARLVGGVGFTETGRYPFVPEREITVIPSEVMTLAQASTRLGFEIALPTWVPEGYTLVDEVRVEDFTRGDSDVIMASLRWRNPEPWEMPIGLIVSWRASGEPMNWLVGPQSVEEVQVNGQPAGLVRGAWNSNEQRWSQSEHITLHWQRGELSYQLQVTEAQVTLADLLRMAESIQ